MLRQLTIRNFAIVDSLSLDFNTGMTVLSGETGAGKSILLDALNLCLGDRADSGIVRHGEERAEVSAEFDIRDLPSVQQWLQEQELDSEGECLIRRTINKDGRSRAYINATACPAVLLKALGEQLVDLHGQHAHQSMLKKAQQRELLDAYAGHDKPVNKTRTAYQQWNRLQQEQQQLQQAARDREDRVELLRFQVQELDELDLQENEYSELEQEHQRLAHSRQLQEGVQGSLHQLYEADEQSVLSALEKLLASTQELQTLDPALGAACELLDSGTVQLREAAHELRDYLENLDQDPQRFEEAEQRLGAIHDLARKHRIAPKELPEHHRTLADELAELEQSGARLDDLEQAIAQALEQYQASAKVLSAGRLKAAKKLAKAVTANMQTLGMAGGVFEIKLNPHEAEPTAHGDEAVEFLVSANQGQPPQPLNKVASGGELSRISLAIQVITAGQGSVPTLIFDEVDVGIGGGTAEIVGQQLRSLGNQRQVLCVTHQPQVAAQGHNHMFISKNTKNKQTTTRVVSIQAEERVQEIARMSGGQTITEQTILHAREMIERAAQEAG